MALRTLGTPAATTLSGFVVGTNDLTPADVATLMNSIKNDQVSTVALGLPIWGGAYAQQGLLSIPNRGVLKCLPGDFVGFDTTTGWPILISALAAGTGASWSHS